MDFLKTLMLYMSLTFAASVQNTVAPQETPMPTVTPTVAVTEPAGDAQTSAPLSDPAVTITIPDATATVDLSPTITPNKSYKTLQMNNRSDNVKKMQQRLIELGYLDDGDADGAFGRQTYNAVRAFQKANGLNVDGIAGATTLTHLYEDPNVIANPNKTPEPAATDTPVPAAATEPQFADTDSTIEPPVSTAEPTASPTPDPNALTEMSSASIVLGDSGEKLTCLRQQDGVTIRVNPRLWRTNNGLIYMDMTDLAAGAEGWAFTLSMDGSYHLTAEGYEVIFSADGLSCTVNGESIALAEGDFRLEGTSPMCTATFLEKALNAQTHWDDDEQTMMIQVVPFELSEVTD